MGKEDLKYSLKKVKGLGGLLEKKTEEGEDKKEEGEDKKDEGEDENTKTSTHTITLLDTSFSTVDSEHDANLKNAMATVLMVEPEKIMIDLKMDGNNIIVTYTYPGSDKLNDAQIKKLNENLKSINGLPKMLGKEEEEEEGEDESVDPTAAERITDGQCKNYGSDSCADCQKQSGTEEQ